jgi:SAM-dependent methyltransferase
MEGPSGIRLGTTAPKVWGAADFARVGAQHVLAHELLASAVQVRPRERVLDVGAGTGNAALAAARRGAEVTAVDVVAASLEVAARRAATEGLSFNTRVADALQLPLDDAAFDVGLSTFAIMFAADPARAAEELLRVVRPGGRIGLTAWTAGGFVGRHMAVLAHWSPAGNLYTAPLRWGDAAWVVDLLGDRVTSPRTQTLTVDLCHPSDSEMVEFQRQTLGPMKATFDRLTPEEQKDLTCELRAVIAEFNTAPDGTVIVPAEYLQLTAVRS